MRRAVVVVVVVADESTSLVGWVKFQRQRHLSCEKQVSNEVNIASTLMMIRWQEKRRPWLDVRKFVARYESYLSWVVVVLDIELTAKDLYSSTLNMEYV